MNRDPLCGRTVGAYQLVQKIGHGGMGMVYEAVHTHSQVAYAIKILHPVLTSDELMVARLRREAAVALQLHHPNIVQVLDYGWDDSLGFFLVMELLKGYDLGSILKVGEPLSLVQTTQIAYQVCQALILAHQNGIIHRDLKPPNVFLCEGSDPVQHVKLLDFGIARVLGDVHQTQLTRAGKSFGTPEYMPPEQIRGFRDKIGPATDVYGISIVLFRMLTGSLPFHGKHLVELVNQVVLQPPPMLSHFRPLFTGTHIERLLCMCMAKNPDNRLQSMYAFLEELQEALERDPLLAHIWDSEAELEQYEATYKPKRIHALDEPDPGDATFVQQLHRDDHGLAEGQTFTFGGSTFSFDGQKLLPSIDEADATFLSSEPASDHTIRMHRESAAELAHQYLERHHVEPNERGVLLPPPSSEFLDAVQPNELTLPRNRDTRPTFRAHRSSEAGMRAMRAHPIGPIPPPDSMPPLLNSVEVEAPTQVQIRPLSLHATQPSARSRWMRTAGGFLIGLLLFALGFGVYSFQRKPSRACCTLYIRSSPKGARIIEQGRFLGHTPLRIKRTYNQAFQFVVVKKQYELVTGSWKAYRDSTKHFKLERRRSSLSVPEQK